MQTKGYVMCNSCWGATRVIQLPVGTKTFVRLSRKRSSRAHAARTARAGLDIDIIVTVKILPVCHIPGVFPALIKLVGDDFRRLRPTIHLLLYHTRKYPKQAKKKKSKCSEKHDLKIHK